MAARKTAETTYVVAGDKLTAKIPTGISVELDTELTLDELLSVGALAAGIESGTLSELQIVPMLRSDEIIPARVREKLGGLPARYALPVLIRWLTEAVAPLAALGGEDEGEAGASS